MEQTETLKTLLDRNPWVCGPPFLMAILGAKDSFFPCAWGAAGAERGLVTGRSRMLVCSDLLHWTHRSSLGHVSLVLVSSENLALSSCGISLHVDFPLLSGSFFWPLKNKLFILSVRSGF